VIVWLGVVGRVESGSSACSAVTGGSSVAPVEGALVGGGLRELLGRRLGPGGANRVEARARRPHRRDGGGVLSQ